MVFDDLIIRARSLSKSYGEEVVLTDFNLDVWKGSIFGILGVSGSGKTTALRLLAGFENPDSGIIEMHDKTVFSEEVNLPLEEIGVNLMERFPHICPSVSESCHYGGLSDSPYIFLSESDRRKES